MTDHAKYTASELQPLGPYSDSTGVLIRDASGAALYARLNTVPAPGASGFAKGCIIVDLSSSETVLYTNTGSVTSCLFSAAAGTPPFDPNDLLTGVYGDFMRVGDSVPAASGGLLTRWSGMRDVGASGTDATPFASAPSVGAYGPNGEDCIRFTPATYVVGSLGQGGSSSLNLAASFTPEAATVMFRAKVSDFALLSHPAINFFGAMLVDNAYLGSSTTHEYGFVYPGGPATANHYLANDTWFTLAYVWDGLESDPLNMHVYKNGVLLDDRGGYLGAVNFYRWVTGLYGSTGATVDLAAYFIGNVSLDASEVAGLHTWMEG
jgi:hypothetical protein